MFYGVYGEYSAMSNFQASFSVLVMQYIVTFYNNEMKIMQHLVQTTYSQLNIKHMYTQGGKFAAATNQMLILSSGVYICQTSTTSHGGGSTMR